MSTSTPCSSISMPKKILRWFLLILAGLAVIAIGLFLICVLINANDAALKPEVKALMTPLKYTAEPDKNGYFVLVGMDADEHMIASGAGQAIVREQARLYLENPNRSDYMKTTVYKKAPDASWNHSRCKPVPQNCVEEDLRNRKMLEDGLSRDALYLSRYQMIQQLPEFEEQILPSTFAPLPNYALLARASDMMQTRAAFDIADGRLQEGVDTLVKNDRFLRRMLKQTSTLISRMVTLNLLKKQARMVSELVETYPLLIARHGDALAGLVQPLGPDSSNFAPVFANEARAVLGVVQHLEFDRMDPMFLWSGGEGSTASWINGRMLGLFYQRNATLNIMGSWWQAMLQEANRPPAEYDGMRARIQGKEMEFAGSDMHPYLHVSNPVGKSLIALSVDPYTYIRYMERSADMDGYLRLVGLQIDLRRKKVAADAIQNSVAAAGEPFRSPYDGKSMTWDAGKKQLQFTGRQQTAGNSSDGKTFVVQMR